MDQKEEKAMSKSLDRFVGPESSLTLRQLSGKTTLGEADLIGLKIGLLAEQFADRKLGEQPAKCAPPDKRFKALADAGQRDREHANMEISKLVVRVDRLETQVTEMAKAAPDIVRREELQSLQARVVEGEAKGKG